MARKQQKISAAVAAQAAKAGFGTARLTDKEIEVLRFFLRSPRTDEVEDERDDLPKVKIPTPVVKPKGVTALQIRKAVRRAVQEYSEKHGKALARS